MARYRQRRLERYQLLRAEHFTPLEARELSKLPRNTPALRMLRVDRVARWERFQKIANAKMDRGKWRTKDVPKKWLANLARVYRARRWRVQSGPVGGQQKMVKGAPNPWAMYRMYEQLVGGPRSKSYVSPWELRNIRKGRTTLAKGLVFVQRLEQQAVAKGSLNKGVIRSWLDDKRAAITKARGSQRAQLLIEYKRLEKLL